VWTSNGTALTPLTCSDDVNFSTQSQVTFTTDGQTTYYIVAGGKNQMVGKLKLKVISY
jgi:hypothetical protein